MLSLTAIASSLPSLRRTPPWQPAPPPPGRSVLDRRAAERYAEQAARDAVAARAAGPRLGTSAATSLVPGASLTADLLPEAVTSLLRGHGRGLL